jgi:hypothetical protein
VQNDHPRARRTPYSGGRKEQLRPAHCAINLDPVQANEPRYRTRSTRRRCRRRQGRLGVPRDDGAGRRRLASDADPRLVGTARSASLKVQAVGPHDGVDLSTSQSNEARHVSRGVTSYRTGTYRHSEQKRYGRYDDHAKMRART